MEGSVEFARGSSTDWQTAVRSQSLCQGDTVRVGANSRASISLVNDAVLRIDQNTTLRLIDIQVPEQERSWLELIEGALQSFSRKPRRLTVNTPYINGSIEGTEFVFRVGDTESQLIVLEGTVIAANDQGSLSVPGGAAVAATKGQAPQPRIILKPRDVTHWALYYPPVLSQSETVSPDLQSAARMLAVGRLDRAEPLIAQALAADPQNGKAYALRTVIAVVQNQLTAALTDGEKAAALDDSTAGAIALSYAQQANFRIPAARDGIASAVVKHPNDALAWARLAELELMLGNRQEALDAASKAREIAPDLARSQLVLGYSELASFRSDEAKAAFTQAIALDSADPLAHLGLGLAQISGGDLNAGRSNIELAVALDGSSALLRAYLGKAYFEENRSPLDSQQFAIAKELDPNDPTAYLYDGIRKQTENRPVEALGDFEQTIAMNDRRAVYRSRLLLDKDRAARGASLARVYNDLGFTALGRTEASRSLTADPANASAHRFLSDVYQSMRRREIARVSESFQAQMLQDVNVSPASASSGEANLNVVTAGGPATAGFNEFTPLFQRDQTNFVFSAQSGSQNTRGAEAALSGQYDRYSFSLAGLNYDSDGWRPNNAMEQELYSLFVQAAVSERVNLQAEFRRRESTEGDLAFNFDPDDFVADKTIKRKQDSGRIGLRYASSVQSQWLLSYVHSERDNDLSELRDLPPVVGTTTFTNRQISNEEADQVEAQFLHSVDSSNYILGVAWSESERIDDANVSVDDSVIGNLLSAVSTDKLPTKDPRAYAYVNHRPAAHVTWTLGASYDRFEQATYDDSSFNPKLGLLWDLGPSLRFRAAAFQTVKPALVNNRTLEPTQIAGFNQLFDDINGSKSRRYGAGLDWQAERALKAGIEVTRRSFEEPWLDPLAAQWITETRAEQYHRAYLYWTASPRIALTAALVYDRYNAKGGIGTEFGNLPEEAETWSLPLGISYFDPSGVFAGLTATHVDQSIRRADTAIQAEGDEQFVTVDATVGYRLPKRRGLLSLAATNLSDSDFKYQDDSYREFRDEPSTGPYFPVRTVLARLILNF